MPVHCYGIPCDVEEIQEIADKYKIKVIYDAAHAFGVECDCGSLLNHGDMSVLSFHATKVFHTFEGGAIVCKDKNTKLKIDRLRNFGFKNETEIVEIGLNGKMNEFQAAVGLLQLKTIDEDIAERATIAKKYQVSIEEIKGIKCIPQSSIIRANNAYFPILVEREYKLDRDQLYRKLKEKGIYTRRYFYPLITNYKMYMSIPSASRKNLPIANKIAEQIICLPIYPGLRKEDQDRIIDLLDIFSK